jgi:hypothetical protein
MFLLLRAVPSRRYENIPAPFLDLLAAVELCRSDTYPDSGPTCGVIAPHAAKRVYLLRSCNSNVTGTCFHNVTGLPSRVPGTKRHLRASRRADSSSFA